MAFKAREHHSESETTSAWQEEPLPNCRRSLKASVKAVACAKAAGSSSGCSAVSQGTLVPLPGLVACSQGQQAARSSDCWEAEGEEERTVGV